MRFHSPVLHGNLSVCTARGFDSAWMKHMQTSQHLLSASEATDTLLPNPPCLALSGI